MSLVQCSWRGERIGLEICRSEERAQELRERWDGGVVIIERIFEVASQSSTAARCNLANRVLELCGESLRLDPKLEPAELSAQLQALSSGAPPAPVRAAAFVPPPELVRFAEGLLAAPLDADMLALHPDLGEFFEGMRPTLESLARGEATDLRPLDLVTTLRFTLRAACLCTALFSRRPELLEEPDEDEEPLDVLERGLGMRRPYEPPAVVASRSLGDQDAFDINASAGRALVAADPELEALKAIPVHELTGEQKRRLAALQPPPAAAVDVDGTPLAERDPRTLTGLQKQQLSGVGPVIKPRTRNALTPAGADPRTLTGAEKRALGAQGKKTRQAVASSPPAPSTADLGASEVSELNMLRAFQPAEIDDPDTGDLPVDARAELAARRRWVKPKVQPRKPAPIGTSHPDE